MLAQPKNKFIPLLVPFIAGAFFALGYGVTHRNWILWGSWKENSQETFGVLRPFPGTSLQTFRASLKENSFDEMGSQIQPVSGELDKFIQENSKTTKVVSELIINSEQKIIPIEPIFSKENFAKVFRDLPD